MIQLLKGKIKIDNEIKNSFKRLPEDKYTQFHNKNFRLRRFSKFIYTKKEISDLKKDNKFFQNKKNNRYLGGINRKFEPIEDKIFRKFKAIILNNFKFLIQGKEFEIGLHQIRIRCGRDFVGYPVPEGWHRDGFDYVAIININSKDIEGGISRVRSKVTQDSDSYSCFLKTGEYLFFNDKKFFHFADPINILKSKIGVRDTLVVTFSKVKII